VIRAKAFLARLADGFCRLDVAAGAIVRHEPAGVWWAATPKPRWPEDESGERA